MHIIPYVNDGSNAAPALENHINLFSIAGKNRHDGTPRMSLRGMPLTDYEKIRQDGFDGVQSHIMLSPSTAKCGRAGLKYSAAGIIKPSQLEGKARRWQEEGYSCASIMIGSGNESLREALEIAELVLNTSKKLNFPLYMELHRGTVTQSIKTVLAMIKAYPGLKFNGDFSHYILSYRWQESFNIVTLKRIAPILERIAYLHLRPANSDHIQLAECDEQTILIYRILLQFTFGHFIKNAKPGDKIIAAPELLPSITGYNQLDKTPSGHRDKTNRYLQSIQLKELVNSWFCKIRDNKVSPISFGEVNQNPNNDFVQQNPILFIHSKDDWRQLNSPNLQHAQVIRIALGNGIDSPESQDDLLKAYLKEQRKDKRICLETRRNSITHSLQSTQALQTKHRNIRLCLNLSEWILGEEITPEKLTGFKRNVQQLQNIHSLVTSYATGEHRYNGDLNYLPRAYLSVSVLTERLYSRFYNRLWDKIPVPKISDCNRQADSPTHQAVLYARQQYQKA